MKRTRKDRRTPILPLALVAGLVALAVVRPGYGDDKDLLQFKTANPYLFIMLDSSASMNLGFGASSAALPGDGDNPQSRIYAAKEALYEVFKTVDDVNFGFAAFNQDKVRITAKHWIYANTTALPAGWPVSWPTTAPGATDATDVNTLTDPTTLGRFFRDGSGNSITTAGTCAAPLTTATAQDRLRVNRFPLLGEGANTTTRVWLLGNGNRKYQVQLSAAGGSLGDETITVHAEVHQADGACALTEVAEADLVFQRIMPYVMVDGPTTDMPSNADDLEPVPGLWNQGGVVQSASCDTPKPHTGNGWEGNYDDLDSNAWATIPGLEDGDTTRDDPYCINDSNGVHCTSVRPMPIAPTVFATEGRPVDVGDLLPFHWSQSNKLAFLRRLAPNHGSPVPNFGVAPYVSDARDNNPPRVHQITSGPRPIVAAGQTPLTKAILDFRCWYMGARDGNRARCGEWMTPEGWEDVACSYDSDWGCRRPFLIIISDGLDTCGGNSPTAEVAGMFTESRVRTWALNLGDPRSCDRNSRGALHSITQAGRGECVNVASKQELLDTLQDILNQIREEARAFASAAVPSVQAVADQALYLTNFTPLNNEPVWLGEVKGFAKPVELDQNGRPAAGTEQWNAGTVLKTTGDITLSNGRTVTGQYDPSDFVGANADQRRVTFSRLPATAGTWSSAATDLETPMLVPGPARDPETGTAGFDVPLTYALTMDAASTAVQSAWVDLGKALGILAPERSWGDLTLAEKAQLAEDARDILHFILVRKSAQVTDPVTGTTLTQTYLLGDVFHSDPIVIGQPINSTYLQQDLGGDRPGDPVTDCEVDDDGSASFTGNRGYRCFFDRNKRRRQLLLVGANDGMLHAFNIAQYRTATDPLVTANLAKADFYDNGTGNELFAYVPRAVMPTLRDLSTGTNQQYTVDGPIAGADVFIDPVHDGAPVADERRWRTITVGTLRDGGSALFAVDITQPDKLQTDGINFTPVYDNGGSYLPTCTAGAGYAASSCGPLPFGAPLWEYQDTNHNQAISGNPAPIGYPEAMDEDNNGAGNGEADLGNTWSKPVIGRIRICGDTSKDCTVHERDDAANGGVVDKYVAIFGGGIDPDGTFATDSGSWIYFVDVETGKTLLKREVFGTVPSEISAIDVNQDGYLDRLYFGTTQGWLYRMDLLDYYEPVAGDPPVLRFPGLTTISRETVDNTVVGNIQRVADSYADGADVWPMRAIFDARALVTVTDPVTGAESQVLRPRPIFFRPAVIVAQSAGGLVVAFGTGNRDDLWVKDNVPGRFYVFLDETGTMDAADLPMTDDDFTEVTKDGVATSDNYLVSPPAGKLRGWYLSLANNERVITSGFSLVGITFFATYEPDIGLTDANGDPIAGELGCASGQGNGGGGGGGNNSEPYCSKTGTSNLFLVNATNGNPLMIVGGNQQRYKTIGTFVTTPFSEFTKGSSQDDNDPDAAPTADDLTADEEAILDLLKGLFPDNCKFVNARIQISTVASDTSLQKLASIPICLASSGWKEF